MKKILIAGAQSYIGEAVRACLEQEPQSYAVTVLDTVELTPEAAQFSGFDVVFCVAGIAHIKETAENRRRYFEVNRDLVTEIARAAREAGVRQFILLSSMSVYGMTTGHIEKHTPPHSTSAYGESKLQADEAIQAMTDAQFRFACLRPPMVYGKGCKGNYQSLRKFALKSPVFPKVDNQRSMLFIGNLCAFVKDCIDEEREGLFFPQNAEYTNTSRMVQQIAAAHGKKIRLTKAFNWLLKLAPRSVVKKVFGNLTYELVDTVDTIGFDASVNLTET